MKFHPMMGWRKDSPDPRDLIHTVPQALLQKLPAAVDLRTIAAVPIYNQLALGSCTANAIGGVVQFDRMRQKLANADLVPSRLMLYYLEREMENTISSDAGAEIRDGIKAMAKTGTCFESVSCPSSESERAWPYDIVRFAERPPPACYDSALRHQALKYARISPPQTLTQMKGCLAQGNPFVFGFLVFESFMSDKVAKTGMVPMPSRAEIAAGPLGGHAVAAFGYDSKTKRFLVRNSWGEDWGDHGHCYMPNAYMTNSDLVSDLWQISAVEGC